MSYTTHHIQPGDHIATDNYERAFGNQPKISRELYRVTKRTASQAEAINVRNSHHTIRIRVSDGKVFGEAYVFARGTTPEMVEQHHAEIAMLRRWLDATKRLDDILSAIHTRSLTTEQREALADAWERVKAMTP